ncbi:MAG: hypothetical protein NT030_06675 [Candidatus Saganbacteria bacterium]|nr:hypothetical protein [Candidatus Saganbacteria bacterium]
MVYIIGKEFEIFLIRDEFNIIAKALDVLCEEVTKNPKGWSEGYLERILNLKWEFNLYWSIPDFSVEKGKWIRQRLISSKSQRPRLVLRKKSEARGK